jgi:hypothetical protein
VTHGGHQLTNGDVRSTLRTSRHALYEAVTDRLDGLSRRQAGASVLLGRPSGLTVNHSIRRQVLNELSRHPAQLVWGLHDRDGVIKRRQVGHE